MQLLIDKMDLVREGSRIMHIAPERGIYNRISRVRGIEYEVYDLFPSQYPFADVKRLDLASDCESLKTGAYDLIIHSHVMEHVPCDVTAVFFHLQRSLKETGAQIFSIPILSGYWDCCLGEVDLEERIKRFGQDDHVRRFGASDLHRTLGMVFPLPEDYDLTRQFDESELDRFNVPQTARRGFTSSSVFVMRKRQFKLQSI